MLSVELLTFLGVALVLMLGIGLAVRRARQGEIEAPAAKEALPSGRKQALQAAEDTNDDDDDDPAEALRAGLKKTRGGFVARIGKLLGKKSIDASVMAELEEVLLTADIGVKTSTLIFETVKTALSQSDLTDADTVWQRIREQSTQILRVDAPPLDLDGHKPFVMLVIGVNGAGKTTTIGKLAAKFTRQGKRVLLTAGDTFRAAAVEQLEIWGQRAGCEVVRGKADSDPSSVIFDGIKKAVDESFDVVICDTAGRLHTKKELMEELQKIRRVTGKAMNGAPHETLLVLDSTTGQNAIAQASLFKEAMDITGIALTKLDGTAKGGVILGICDQMKLPVRYVGVGEQVDDLRDFDAETFVAALYDPGEEEPQKVNASRGPMLSPPDFPITGQDH